MKYVKKHSNASLFIQKIYAKELTSMEFSDAFNEWTPDHCVVAEKEMVFNQRWTRFSRKWNWLIL